MLDRVNNPSLSPLLPLSSFSPPLLWRENVSTLFNCAKDRISWINIEFCALNRLCLATIELFRQVGSVDGHKGNEHRLMLLLTPESKYLWFQSLPYVALKCRTFHWSELLPLFVADVCTHFLSIFIAAKCEKISKSSTSQHVESWWSTIKLCVSKHVKYVYVVKVECKEKRNAVNRINS